MVALYVAGVVLLVFGFTIAWDKLVKTAREEDERVFSQAETNAAVKSSGLRWLPAAFYFFAVIGFTAWILIAINLESWVAFGYGIGSMIACFASGRVIDLLQNIDDELYRKRVSKQDSEYLRQLVEIEKFKLKRFGQMPSE